MSERVLLRVEKGRLVPADGYTAKLLRERSYHIGDQLIAELRKPRNPAFHRLVHAFGQLCVDNLDDFHGLDAHAALKKVQTEGDIACDHMPVRIEGQDVAEYRLPQSLSFASMDQGKFHDVFRLMCEHVSSVYWTDLDADQIEEMAQAMVDV